MNDVETLIKILRIRENEKSEAQIQHTESIAIFEKLAEKLYELLKRKEEIEDKLALNGHKSITIGEIQNTSLYLEDLTKQAFAVQAKVNKARQEMDVKRNNVTEAHIEMKKIEKMIEFRQKEAKAEALKIENMLMDEISIQQFLAKNG